MVYDFFEIFLYLIAARYFVKKIFKQFNTVIMSNGKGVDYLFGVR